MTGMEESEFNDAREDLMALYDDYELINSGKSEQLNLAPSGQSKNGIQKAGPKFTPPKPTSSKGKGR